MPPGATTVYVGGQNAVGGAGRLVGGDDAVAQTPQVMTNLNVAVAAAGASVHDLVMMTILAVGGALSGDALSGRPTRRVSMVANLPNVQ
ncbi:Rid family hydrolase [Actinophytocola sp.]|uniref:Rid family hydrolase n=1 Tax=Actinophytocola sp. TaxID=1872138 RepID=UPI003D6AF4FE